ncbi:MAG: hypothetical protein R3C49_05390 [Planctomycetaceae bacterium]
MSSPETEFNGAESADERLSEQFDCGQLTLESLSETERQQVHAWETLGGLLRQLPKSASPDLTNSILAVIAETQPTEPVAVSGSSFEARRDSTRQLKRALVTLATSCCVLLVAVNVALQEQNRPTGDRLTAAVLRNPGNWDVVVLDVPEGRQDVVSSDLKKLVAAQGRDLQPLADASRETTRAVETVITSAMAESIPADTGTSRDESLVGSSVVLSESDREELRQRFAESMQTPTQSDHYFGEMYVVLPRTDDIRIQTLNHPGETNIAAVPPADSEMLPSSAQSTGSELSAEDQLSRLLQQNSGRPVLVVFRRRGPAMPEIQGSLSTPDHHQA